MNTYPDYTHININDNFNENDSAFENNKFLRIFFTALFVTAVFIVPPLTFIRFLAAPHIGL